MKATKIFRALGLLVLIAFAGTVSAQMGEIRGIVTDSATGKPMDGVTVSVIYKGYPKSTLTNPDGSYSIKPIEPGTYDVSFLVFGNPKPHTVHGVVVSAEGMAFVDRTLGSGIMIDEVKVYSDKIDMKKPPLICTIPAADIRVSAAGRGIGDLVIGTAPRVSAAGLNKGQLSLSGSRPDATQYYVDGVKIYGEAYIPQLGIEEITVLNGGLPAKYGDTTSGVILITTKSFR